MNRRLYRSPTDRFIAGVAGGMAESWDLDPSIVRIGWALLTILTGGVLLLIYVLMAFVVPLRPVDVPVGYTQAYAPTGYPPPPEGGWPQGAPPPGALPPGMPPPAYPAPERRRDHTGGVVFGVLLIAVGIWFLAREWVDFDFGRFWPIGVIGLGALLILAAFARSGRR